MRGEHHDHLITVRGIATRVSDVKPSVQVNAYTCDRGGYDDIFQPVTSRPFTPMTEYPSDECIATRVSDVKPSVQVNAYTCDRGGYDIFQPITSRPFTPITECPSDECIATRISDVKPSVQVNAYTCDRGRYDDIFQPVTSRPFTPMTECPSDECRQNNSKGQLFLSTRASKFLPFQEVKIHGGEDRDLETRQVSLLVQSRRLSALTRYPLTNPSATPP